MKYSVYIAYTKDGYIATEDDSVAFLSSLKIEGDAGYADYLNSVDTLVFGSSTYKFIIDSGTDWPYEGKKCFVLTSRPNDFKDDRVTFFNGTVKELALEMPWLTKSVWVMGGANVIAQYLKEGMISEMILSEANVEIGKGIKLFENWESVMGEFEEIDVKEFGDITNHYYKLRD